MHFLGPKFKGRMTPGPNVTCKIYPEIQVDLPSFRGVAAMFNSVESVMIELFNRRNGLGCNVFGM
jgi:hypothetical protein